MGLRQMHALSFLSLAESCTLAGLQRVSERREGGVHKQFNG